jgi:hypothetical protein
MKTITLNEHQQKCIEILKERKGFQEAYNRLIETKTVRSCDIQYFNISMDNFLKYSQLHEEKRKTIIEQLIDMFK